MTPYKSANAFSRFGVDVALAFALVVSRSGMASVILGLGPVPGPDERELTRGLLSIIYNFRKPYARQIHSLPKGLDIAFCSSHVQDRRGHSQIYPT